MSRRRGWVAVAVVAVLAVVGVGAALGFVSGRAPEAVELERAVGEASAVARGASAGGATAQGGSQGGGLTGTWNVVGEGASFVGYRVQEELAGVGATTAVGRTTAVRGSLTYDGEAITAVSVVADVSQLRSDQSRRDQALRQQALETGQFPTATFELASPIAVPDGVSEGATIDAVAAGKLTLHGVTREVSIPLQGKLADGLVVVVGRTEVAFADYNIAQPRAASVLSVADRATLELQLVFAQAV